MDTKDKDQLLTGGGDPLDVAESLSAHPVGTGLGAGAGAVAGAAAGTPGGPVGMAAGAAIGALAGGLVGQGVAAYVNPAEERVYWQDHYRNENYYDPNFDFDDYHPAYEVGYTVRGRSDTRWEELEDKLGAEWDSVKGQSRLTWEQAKAAARSAWDKIDKT